MRDDDTRMFVSASAGVGALLLAINNVVRAAPWRDWWVAAALLIVAVAAALWPRRAARTVSAPVPVEEAAASPVVAEQDRTAPPVVAAEESAPPAEADDLKIIEGIGPKIAAALEKAGISTFARLAAATQADLEAAIHAAGISFAPSLPTWAEQARFAARGDWDGLKALQESLTAGRRK
ncbi:MAG: hypothetical protein HXY41_07270 [Chloroflexi bacterium]|nr:hypothetical protein [Chloroflexota bacterium]